MQFSRSSASWLLYLIAIKRFLGQLYELGPSEHDDYSILVQWVFYYDTLARLGIKHWGVCSALDLYFEKAPDHGAKREGCNSKTVK